MPFQAHGRSETVVCGPRPACYGRGAADAPLPEDAPRLRLVGNMTWNDTLPGSGEMAAYLLVIHSDGSWSWEEDVNPREIGTPPLYLDWDLAPYEGQRLHLHLAPASSAGPVEYGVRQEWKFDGHVVRSLPG